MCLFPHPLPVTRAERESGLEKSLHFLLCFFLRWESLKSGAALLTQHSRQPGKGRILVVSKIICKVQCVNLHFFGFSLCFCIILTYMLHLFVGFVVGRILCALQCRCVCSDCVCFAGLNVNPRCDATSISFPFLID